MYYYYSYDHNLTRDDVFESYKKLKTLCYHDSSDLFLRKKIAEFESDSTFETNEFTHSDIEQKIDDIFHALTSWDEIQKEIYWNSKIQSIKYKILPKNFNDELTKDGISFPDNFISNKKSNDDLTLESVNIFFDGDLELSILSVLWCMKIGYILDMQLEERCYGNRLIITESTKNKEKQIIKGSGLFKPYYKQYQKWRDEGIDTAKNIIDKGEDVLFLNLDLKNFYYCSNVSFKNLKKAVEPNLDNSINQYIHHLFEGIHEKYTSELRQVKYPFDYKSVVSENEFIIPIGMPSSYIISNWFLTDFDKRVKNLINPSYYSRYVDDIFLVITNPKIDFIDNCEKTNFNYSILPENVKKSNLTRVEKIILELFHPIVRLVNSADTIFKETENKTSTINYFKLECYDNLYFQGQKTLAYYFDHNSTISVLDKFKEELEKRSSEFRYLPIEELNKKTFDDEAFELIFDGTTGKIRTLKDYKENRYGVSVYFAKRIYSALRKTDVNSELEVDKILKFFNGKISLDYYRQWEKIFTYFVVTDSTKGFVKFYENTLDQIVKLKNDSSDIPFLNSQLSRYKIYDLLIEYFAISAQMAISLNPSFYNSIKIEIQSFNKKHENIFEIGVSTINLLDGYKIYRIANLLRHNFVFHPLLNYTTFSTKSNISLIDKHLPTIYNDKFFDIDYKMILYSPRKIKFWEAAWYEIFKNVQLNGETGDPNHKRILTDLLNDFKVENGVFNYLDLAYDLYYKINYWFVQKNKFGDHFLSLKKNIFGEKPLKSGVDPEIKITEFNIPNGGAKKAKIKVALSNMEVKESNYEKSMLGKPNIDNRYEEFANLLNKVEHEECDVFVMPELCVPYSFIPLHLEFSSRSQKALVTGIEHWTTKNVAYNFIMTSLPFEIDGEKDTVPIIRLKNHYAPIEESWIRGYRTVVPKPAPYRYHLYRWRGCYFAVYYCFELGDIVHRTLFRSKVDFLISSIWNLDVNYYASIADSTSRDIHCYYLQVNTRQFGDTRVTAPKKTDQKDLLKIKGGKNDVVLFEELEIDKLREFQYKDFDLQHEDKNFKPTPADFDHNSVRIRQENKSFYNDEDF